MALDGSNGTYLTLTAMLTPAIFLTANGSLIISTSNRMSRIVDRIDMLNDQGDQMGRGSLTLDHTDLRLENREDQLGRLCWRSDRIRIALLMLYLAFASFAGTSLALAVDVWTGNRLVAVPTGLAMLGVGLMLGACVNLVREALEALRSTRVEIRFYHELEARRRMEAVTPEPRGSGAG